MIEKATLRGAKITSLHALDGYHDGVSTLTCYFTVDRGFTFCLPWPGEPWHRVEVPPEARILTKVYMGERPSLRRRAMIRLGIGDGDIEPLEIVSLAGKCVLAGVFFPDMGADLDCYGPDDAFLLFEDGSRLGCLSAAPEGIAPGLAYTPAKDNDVGEGIVNFFDLPIINDKQGEQAGC